MFEFEIQIHPTLEQIRAWVEGLEREVLNDLTEFWEKWATPAVIEEIARIFATEGYGAWPPLSPKYQRWKARHYPGKRILRREDEYFRAATKRKGAGNLFRAEKDEMTFGVDLGYFATKFGFPYPAALEKSSTAGMPARPVFETAEQSQVLKNNLVAALKNYLNKQIAKETKRYFGRGKSQAAPRRRVTVTSSKP